MLNYDQHYVMPCGCIYDDQAEELLRACTFHIQAALSLGETPLPCTPSSASSSSAAPNSAPRR